jgi:regulatory protein spx
MTVTVYGATCASSRRSKEWLTKNGIRYNDRNIIKNPLTVDELQGILRMTVDGTDEIISTRSKTFKELNLDIESLPLQQLLELIHEHPRLLRRPIIMDEKRLQVGYHEDDIRQFLPRTTRRKQILEYLGWKPNYLQPAKG